jgi:hypothetical protein
MDNRATAANKLKSPQQERAQATNKLKLPQQEQAQTLYLRCNFHMPNFQV